MSRVGLVLHHQREEAAIVTREVAAWLGERDHHVELPEGDAALAGLEDRGVPEDWFGQELDLVVSLGGDGTMLRTVSLVSENDVPILGVNFGQLGYLTEVDPADLSTSLEQFFAGTHRIEERMLLEIRLAGDGAGTDRHWVALNEAVLERTAAGHTVRLGVDLDGEFFTTYAADALIVATPTGSTAYSLSARGPIVAPDHRAILLTPVSPHMLFDRTLILNCQEVVRLEVQGHRPATLSVDGQPVLDLVDGDAIECTGSPHAARLVTFGARDFHQILKAKFASPTGEALMLAELAVENLGVIDRLQLVLGPGMTALTGETGAGKTLLVEAVDLLVGGRADPVLVGPAGDEAVVEGRFDLGNDEEIVLRRVVPSDGRSRAYVDGRLATAAALTEAGRLLVDLHGQHAHQSLLQGGAERAALDRFGDVDLSTLEAAKAELREVERALADLGGDDRARARELDLLRFQVAEIDAAAITGPGEDEDLEAEGDRLGDAVAHREAGQAAADLLLGEDAARDALATAGAALADRSPFKELATRLVGLQADLEDVAAELRDATEQIEPDPERLSAVRERRHLLSELRRKYGDTLAEVLEFRAETAARLSELESHEERAAELDARRAMAEKALSEAATEVGRARRAAAPGLAEAAVARLRELAMPNARLEIQVGADPGDDVTILFSANPGSPPLPLAKVASGGELARTMLALRLVTTDAPPTLVFDEVDAGIGGTTALALAAALAELGGEHQVLVVTHLPQVAAFADAQVTIEKEVTGDRTATKARPVDGEDRVVELSRMLSGQPDSTSGRQHAGDLLEEAAARRARR